MRQRSRSQRFARVILGRLHGVLGAVLLLLLWSGTPRSVVGQVALDIKSPVTSLINTSPAMLGTRAFLQEASWAHLTEFGEDYAIWLQDYERIKNGDRITVRMHVELRTPSLLALGSLLERREIQATFRAQDEWNGVRSVAQAIKRQARNSTAAFMVEALHVGEAAYRAVCDIMDREPRITVKRRPGAVPENEPQSSRNRPAVRPEPHDGDERSPMESRLRVARRQGLYVYVAGWTSERASERLRGRRVVVKDAQTAEVRGRGRVIAVRPEEITVELQTVRGPGPAENDRVVLAE